MTKQEFIEKWYPNKAQFTIDLDSVLADQPDKPTEWISVKDRLPEERVRVLCWNGYRIFEKSWEQYTNQDDEWFKATFTHWLPMTVLPTPPQKQKP